MDKWNGSAFIDVLELDKMKSVLKIDVGTGKLATGFFADLVAVLIMAAIVAYLCMNADKKLKFEYAFNGKKESSVLSGKM